MKNISLFIVIFGLFSFFCFSQEIEENESIIQKKENQENLNEESFQKINFLIRNGLNKNFLQIQQESLTLTNTQKLTLYGLNENKFGTPLALNLLLGFGIGSFVQSDIVGGVIGLLGDVTGYFVLITYFVKIGNASNWLNSRTNELSKQILADPIRASRLKEIQAEYNKKISDALPLIGISAGILAVSKVIEIIMPITYSPRYNNKLKEALNYGELSFKFLPSIDINGNGGLTFAMNYNF